MALLMLMAISNVATSVAHAASYVISGLEEREEQFLSTLLEDLEGPEKVVVAVDPGLVGKSVLVRVSMSDDDVRTDEYGTPLTGNRLAMHIFETAEDLSKRQSGPMGSEGPIKIATETFEIWGMRPATFYLQQIRPDETLQNVGPGETIITTNGRWVVLNGLEISLSPTNEEAVSFEVAPRDNPRAKSRYIFRFHRRNS